MRKKAKKFMKKRLTVCSHNTGDRRGKKVALSVALFIRRFSQKKPQKKEEREREEREREIDICREDSA